MERRDTLIVLLSEAAEELTAQLVERLGAAGYTDIRPAHRLVFAYIDADGTRLTDLAERAHVTHPSMSELVTGLVTLGYLERVPDPTDGRARLIRLTAEGRRVQRRAIEEIADIESTWLRRLGPPFDGGLVAALTAARRRQGATF